MATVSDHMTPGIGQVAVDAPLTAADGTPLRKKLAQANRRARLRATLLVAPLLLFVLITFIVPIGQMLVRSFHEPTFSEVLPRTTEALKQWDGADLPDEAVFAAFADDLKDAKENRTIGQVATRVNYAYAGSRSAFTSAARKSTGFEAPYKEALIAADDVWGERDLWAVMKRASKSYTPEFYLAAVDRTTDVDGNIVMVDDFRQIYVKILLRTLYLAGVITGLCLLLGYPVAFLLASLPTRTSNLLMILVLLPFWTSLLVRTTAWIALLQSQGIINDVLVAMWLIDDDSRLQMIYNQTGTIIAMTHILLPFSILPLFSVMKTIPPTYMRAARSLGATPWTAFWKIYVPQTVPGIAAGVLLVFILAVGYYITPALVGGQDGQLISNFIALHMQKTLNWSMAAALGGILLATIMVLYWLFNKIVGIDRLKLG